MEGGKVKGNSVIIIESQEIKEIIFKTEIKILKVNEQGHEPSWNVPILPLESSLAMVLRPVTHQLSTGQVPKLKDLRCCIQ